MVTSKPAFTLVEVMIYIAVFGILLLAIFAFFYDSMFHEKRLSISSETLTDSTVIMQRLNSELRNSVGVSSIDQTSVCLINNKSVYPYGSTSIYYLDNSIYIARSADSDCSPLQTSSAINSNLSLVTGLSFERTSSNWGEIVRYTIEFSHPASIQKSGLPGSSANFVYSSSVTLREW